MIEGEKCLVFGHQVALKHSKLCIFQEMGVALTLPGVHKLVVSRKGQGIEAFRILLDPHINSHAATQYGLGSWGLAAQGLGQEKSPAFYLCYSAGCETVKD